MSCGAWKFVDSTKLDGCIYKKCPGCESDLCKHWTYCPRCINLQVEDMKKIVGVPRGAFDRLQVEVDDQRRKVRQVTGLLDAANRLNDEYRRFCETLLGSVETDLTFWRRRAQFSLDAMGKRVDVAPKKCGKISLKFDECKLEPNHDGKHAGHDSTWGEDE